MLTISISLSAKRINTFRTRTVAGSVTTATRHFETSLRARRVALAAAFVAALVMLPTPSQAKTITWAGCGISKSAFMAEMAAAYKKKTGVEIDFKGGGATKGIREVTDHKVDIGGTCRHVLENRQTMMTVPEERYARLIPVAWDALVVIVHKDNPIDNITRDQIRALYTGKITNWKELGGRNEPIELYVRKGKISGVGRTLRELVFNNYDQEFTAAHVMDSTGPLERAISENPRGIGITGVSSANKLERQGHAKILKLEGKDPSYDNIKNGHYLLYRPLYMVTHLANRDPEVKKFIDFVMGPEGARVMRGVGTVPYGDAIDLWTKYLDQQNKAIERLASNLDEERKLQVKPGNRRSGTTRN